MNFAFPVSTMLMNHSAAFFQFAESLKDSLLRGRFPKPAPLLSEAVPQYSQALRDLAKDGVRVSELGSGGSMVLGEFRLNPGWLHYLTGRQTVEDVQNLSLYAPLAPVRNHFNECRGIYASLPHQVEGSITRAISPEVNSAEEDRKPALFRAWMV